MSARRAKGLALRALAAAAGGCSSTATDALPAGPRHSGALDGVAWSLTERAHDGVFAVPTDAVGQEVDANARLVVSFAVATADDLAAAGPEWQAVTAGLARLRTLLADGPALDRLEVDERDAPAVADLRQRLQQHYRGVRAFAAEFKAAIEQHRSDLHVDQILNGSFDGAQQGPLGNAARWLAGELERLRTAAAARVGERERVRVLVQAYHEPLDGERQPLHVANYDNLPVGDLQPVPRFGLAMAPQERARLDAEIAASKAAAAAIRELAKDGKSFGAALADRIGDLRRSLGSLAEAVRQAEGWQQQVAAALAAVQQLAAQTQDGATKAAAGELAAAFTDLQTALHDLAAMGQTRQELEAMVAQLQHGEPQAVFGLLGRIETVVGADLGVAIDAVAQPAQKAAAALAVLARRLPAAELEQVVATAVRQLVATLQTQLPATLAFAELVRGYLADGAQRRTVAEVLAAARDVAIPRPLDDLPDGTIDLQRAGVTLGDHVGVSVRFVGGEGPDAPTLEETAADTAMVLTGLHRRITGQLIFARADHGAPAATRWQANVAAVAAWHYRYRDAATSNWSAFWNVLDPGLGIHVASLDQNDDTAEVGLGVNLSLFAGLVTGGYGYNLSTPGGDGEYYFVGVDLLDVLRKAGTTFGAGR